MVFKISGMQYSPFWVCCYGLSAKAPHRFMCLNIWPSSHFGEIMGVLGPAAYLADVSHKELPFED